MTSLPFWLEAGLESVSLEADIVVLSRTSSGLVKTEHVDVDFG